MGEFGAVSVVSGHIRGKTETIPLHIEALYNDLNVTGAFATAFMTTMASSLASSVRIEEPLRNVTAPPERSKIRTAVPNAPDIATTQGLRDRAIGRRPCRPPF